MKKSTRLLLLLTVIVCGVALGLLGPRLSLPSPGLLLPVLLAGMLAGNLLTHLLLAALARPAGLVPLLYGFGVGRRTGTLRLGQYPLALRSVPLPFFYGLHQALPAPRGRAWAAVLTACAPAPVLGVALAATTGGGWQVFGVAMVVPLLDQVLLARYPGTPGWILLRLPTAPDAVLAATYPTPAEAAAARAMEAGRAAEAVAALAAGPGSGTLTGDLVRVRALLVTGDWAAALERAERLAAPPELAVVAWSADLVRAQALACAADSGLLAPAEYLPRLEAAVAGVGSRPQGAAVRADLERLRGEREAAVRTAGRAVRIAFDSVSAADAACTLAAALLAAGQPAQGAAALARARKLQPGLARIALVERRAAGVVLD